ncbi:DUF1003 domain-containing protein [Desulfomicrobium escambiense]|uniref:DUF1003 domain-containing protein n=1 Tax=Desulfomicrobium escambiense TaxID=29503 RepID=UPI0003F78F35|nr:DUF1003 domain-containing protein [Desulfomicrobium escambiense]
MPETPSAEACSLCGRSGDIQNLVPISALRPSLQRFILSLHPGLDDESRVCAEDLNEYRDRFLAEMLEEEKGELTRLEEDVLRSLRDQDLLSSNINEEYSESLTMGERLADRLADFGGSWKFILIFAGTLVVWICWNAYQAAQAFDPYPFILLNLVLSCLAALQAPVIMMSQNRQEAKDRLRSENDYQVNLKAELEIKHLNEKVDHLLTRQWQRLLEIQDLQVQLIEDLRSRSGEGPSRRERAG